MKYRMRRFHVGQVQVYLSDEANRHIREVTIMLRLLAKGGSRWKWEATAALAHAIDSKDKTEKRAHERAREEADADA